MMRPDPADAHLVLGLARRRARVDGAAPAGSNGIG